MAATPDLRRVSIDIVDASADEVSRQLSEVTGRQIAFRPSQAGERVSISAHEMPLEDLLDHLSLFGGVGAAHAPFVGHVRIDEPVSLQATGITGVALAGIVDSLTGGRGRLTPAQPEALVNLEVQSMRLSDFLKQLALFGEVTFDGREVNPDE